MKCIMKWMGIIALGIFPFIGKGQVSFEARTNAKEIFEGNYVEVKFVLKNASGKNFQLPELVDFDILSGPSRSVSTTIINGRRSQELSYTYLLTPKKTGNLIIESAFIEADNQTLKSNPIAIKVLEATQQSTEEEGAEYFVRAEIEADNAYVGQQIRLKYKLYTRINIDNINILKESEYQGFYVEELLKFDSQVNREIVNGQQYYTKVLKQVALFPQQAGQLEIEPMQLQLGIADGRGRSPFGSFFYSQPLKRFSTVTNKVVVSVKSLPIDAPDDFIGAVGNYKFQAVVNNTDPTTDDLIVLKISIDGTGDIKRILTPEFEFPSEFEVYPPKVIEDNSLEVNGNIYGKKVIEYLFLPKHPGSFEINPSISFFDPSQGEYIQKKSSTITLNIKPGINYQKSLTQVDLPKNGSKDSGKMELKPIKTNINLDRNNRLVWGSSTFYIVGFSPFLFLVLLLFYRFSSSKSIESGASIRHKKARQLAEKRLREASDHLNKGEGNLFYKAITNAMLGYLADKLGMNKSALNKDQIGIKLSSLGLDDNHIQKFMDILNTSERALYAGLNQTEAMKSVYENAADIIAQIEVLARTYRA